jgi:2'-5' RNA ligase
VRLFVAVWPPDEILDRLAGLRRPERAGVRWTTRDQWHVTVRFLGQVDGAEEVKGALLAAGKLATPTLSIGPVTRRLGPYIICLPVTGLDEVSSAVTSLTAPFGEPPPDRPFRGHLTLGRGKKGANMGGLGGEPFEASWTADEVTLVASNLHPHGARYEVIDQVPLGVPLK